MEATVPDAKDAINEMTQRVGRIPTRFFIPDYVLYKINSVILRMRVFTVISMENHIKVC